MTKPQQEFEVGEIVLIVKPPAGVGFGEIVEYTPHKFFQYRVQILNATRLHGQCVGFRVNELQKLP